MTIDKDSPDLLKDDPRREEIIRWIESDLNITDFTLEIASADASFRRYFRLRAQGNSWIIMDAPPDKEDCQPFVKLAKLIEAAGVNAPHIFSFNQQQGFMQISDLGSTAYLDKLNESTVDELYVDAIQALVKMQRIDSQLMAYDEALLTTEMNLFKDWYLQKHLGLQLAEVQQRQLAQVFDILINSALQQPVVFVHRDYHSRNLMVTPQHNPGVIDFQDAVIGPASYDLVSLIKDCYISWPRSRQLKWIDEYLNQSNLSVDKQTFIKQLDLMGMQRHLKAIGIFCRLNHRDAKPGYLNDIPRTLAYVFDVCKRYDELTEFATMLNSLGVKADRQMLEYIQ